MFRNPDQRASLFHPKPENPYKRRRRVLASVVALAFGTGLAYGAGAFNSDNAEAGNGYIDARIYDVQKEDSATVVARKMLRSLLRPGQKKINAREVVKLRDQIVRGLPDDFGHQSGHLQTTDEIVLPSRFNKLGRPAFAAGTLSNRLPMGLAIESQYHGEAPAVIDQYGGHEFVIDPHNPVTAADGSRSDIPPA